MIEKTMVTYNEIDELTDYYTRMITAIIEEAKRNAGPPPRKYPPKIFNTWPYDEPTWPVISPERFWNY